MIIIKIDDKEFECVTTLRVCMQIQAEFRKPYMKVLGEIEELDIREQIKILFCGIKLGKDKDKIDFEGFIDLIADSQKYGLDGFSEDLERFVNAIQYPGLSEEEIEKKLKAKAEKYKKMKSYGI